MAVEALVIVTGVVIALAADDWRQSRGEAQEALRSLEIIVDELRGDSAELVITREGAQQQAEAAQWLFANWKEASPSQNEIEGALQTFEQAPRPRLRRAGYEGLINGNRLRLVDDDPTRRALIEYYEIHQPSILEYWTVMWQRRERMLTGLSPHIEHLGPPGDPAHVTLRGTWASLTSDPALHADLVRYGGGMVFAGDWLAQVQVELQSLLLQAGGMIERP